MTTVLWEEAELYGFVVEPADRFEETLATMRALRQASNWGEIRAAELAPWGRRQIEQYEEHLADELEAVPGDDEPWDYEDIAESVIEVMPLPHDAANTAAWLGRDVLAAHAEISGGSPGGHIDSYRIRDRDGFLAALETAGFEPVHRPGLLQELFNA
jgi:hypothetical protein